MKKNGSKSSEDKTKPISLKNNVLVQELEKELLLYDLDRNKAFCLNETSLMVWNLCDGENTVEDIRHKVSIQLKTNIPEEIIWLTLEGLKNEKLLNNHKEITINFKGLNRREIIKKVGFSTLIALPLISTIVSPNAAAAQSQVCRSSTTCLCADASCLEFGAIAVLQTPCTSSTCSDTGGVNCWCRGPFFCGNLPGTPGERFGMCGVII